jgi:hypothetical protein
MVKPESIDVALCERLVVRALAGDDAAMRELVEHLWPRWLEQARASKSMGSLSHSEDHVHEVATRIAERIGRKRAHGLRLYSHWREAHVDKDFGDWMRIVGANVVREYVREQMGHARVHDGEVSRKRLLNEFTRSLYVGEIGIRPPFTEKQAAREAIEFARTRLPPDQFRALALWLEGGRFEEMDRALGTTAGGSRKLMRAGVATLRAHFSAGSAPKGARKASDS